MLVTLLDGQGEPHIVAWQGQDQINDASGALGVGAVGVAPGLQQVLAANPLRAGWLFQNTSQAAMLLNEVNALGPSSWVVGSGEFFPPCGYPIPTGAIKVMGTADSQAGDSFACREWVNGTGE